MADAITAIRFASRLRRYVSTPVDALAARHEVRARLDRREAAFLELIAQAVYGRRESVYRRLVVHAGIELGDVEGLVKEHGLEGALAHLYAAGVTVGLDEFRGRRTLRRGQLEIATRPADFDNPLLVAAWAARTSGSRSSGRRVLVDLDLLAYEAGHHALFLEAFGLAGRPYAVWLSAPPGVAGLKNVLRHVKLGWRVEHWFSQHRPRLRTDGLVPTLTPEVLRVAQALGSQLPVPEHVPLERADVVARWLAARAQEGKSALLETNASSAVRVAAAAAASRLSVEGSVIRVGGEPFTAAKARVLDSVGVRAACHYSMGEVGRIGLACAAPQALDDVHFLTDKLALLQPDASGSLVLTTLLAESPKLLLNVEVDDRAVVEKRICGCPLGELGLVTHLREIRSDKKLTSEGMTFLGADLSRLVEEALPARIGGTAGDFQLVERDGAPPVVEVRVSPEIGQVSEADVIATVLAFLASPDPARRMMAARWQDAGTLRIVRALPVATDGGKVLPVHVARGDT